MAYAAYNYTITDESGNVVTGCSIEVRREIDNVLVPLYSDRDGALAISNPFTDSTGTGRFHAAGSAYKITASKTGFSRSFRFVPIGLAGETDFTFTNFFGIWDAATTYPLGAYVIYNDVGIFLSTADDNLNNAPDSATPGSTADWVYYPGVVGPQGETGLIGTWEGPWVTGTAYSINDAVSQSGSSYICIVSHTSGTFSTDLAAAKWELVAQKGDTGAAGVDGTGLFTRVRVVDTTGAAVATDYENGDTIDGVVLATDDLVLRATSGGNSADGVYVVPASGAASRDSSFDTYNEHPGAYFSVMEGTTNADKLWRCTSNKGGTLGTTDLVFSEFTSGGGAGANLILNSDGRIDQSALGAVTTDNDDYGSSDLWYSLTQTASITVEAKTNGEDGTPYYQQLKQTQASAQRMGRAQIIESANCRQARGQGVALSGRIRCSASQSIRYAILEWTGTADVVTSDVVNSWTNGTFTAGQFFNSTTLNVLGVGDITPAANTWTNLTALLATGGSSLNNLIVLIWTEGTAAQDVTLDLGRMKLETGATATAWQQPDLARELVSVQRHYFEISAAASNFATVAVGQAATATRANAVISFPVEMRVAPACSLSSAGHWAFTNAAVSAGFAWSSFSASITPKSAVLDVTCASGLVAGDATLVQANNTTSARIYFDARL